MPAYNRILFEVDGAVATLTLNRPGCRNDLDREMGGEIQSAMRHIEGDKSLRALIVTGAGSAFCAAEDTTGATVTVGAHTGADVDDNGVYPAVLASLRSSRVPVVMAINGVATGAGFALALCGDLLLAVRSASFIQALDRGLINECLEADALLPRAQELAARLAQGPTRALAMTRQLVDEGSGNSFEAQYRRELEVNRQLRDCFDGREGVQAFLDKRPAQFRGD